MPVVLSSVTDFEGSTLALTLADQVAALGPGGLDEMLLRASARVNNFCRRKLGAPPTTQVDTGGVSVGAMSVNLKTVANVLEGDVLVFTGTGEIAHVTGADVTKPAASPYPGTVNLGTPAQQATNVWTGLKNSYSAGAPVQVLRQDFIQMRGKETTQGDALYPISQEGQVALAHAPIGAIGISSRKLTLREYPFWPPAYAAFQSLFWGNTETPADLTGAYQDSDHAWIRLVVGAFNPKLTMWRVLYNAGFITVPYDVQEAVHFFMAGALAMGENPWGGTTMRNADLQVGFPTGPNTPPNSHIAEAERILCEGMYRRSWN